MRIIFRHALGMQTFRSPLFEKVPVGGVSSLAVREFRWPSFTYPWHEHPEVELTWIVRGRGLRYVGDSVEPFEPGDFCLIGSNLPHTWLSESPCASGVHSRVLQFDPLRLGEEFLRLPEFAGAAHLLKQAEHGLQFRRELRPEAVFRRIQRAGSPLQQLAALLEILETLVEAPSARALSLSAWPRNPCTEASDDRLARVMSCIASRSDGPLPQREVARVAGLTPAGFSRFFRHAVGRTFHAYVTDLRLGRACRLLLETGRTVSEIAFASGFGNLSNFNRSFRLARGMSPRTFRNAHRT